MQKEQVVQVSSILFCPGSDLSTQNNGTPETGFLKAVKLFDREICVKILSENSSLGYFMGSSKKGWFEKETRMWKIHNTV